MYSFASQCSLHSQYSSTHSCSGSENGHVLGGQTSSHPPHYYLRSRAVSSLHQKTCQWWGSSYHSLPSSHCERSHTLTAKRAPHKRDGARFARPECWQLRVQTCRTQRRGCRQSRSRETASRHARNWTTGEWTVSRWTTRKSSAWEGRRRKTLDPAWSCGESSALGICGCCRDIGGKEPRLIWLQRALSFLFGRNRW
jgi:hypothetical protein